MSRSNKNPDFLTSEMECYYKVVDSCAIDLEKFKADSTSDTLYFAIQVSIPADVMIKADMIGVIELTPFSPMEINFDDD